MSETATSPGLPAEPRGKTGKDGDWKEIRHVERYCRTGSIMTGMLSVVDAFWGEVENASQRKAGRAMNVDLLDLATKSYQRRQSKFQ